MLVATKGIVLHKTKYSDQSLIVKIFTEQLGTQSFIIKNAFNKKNKLNQAYFSPLALLEVVFDHKNTQQIHFLKEIHHYANFEYIPFDLVRNSLLIFYNELLYKLLFDVGEDAELFCFMERKILELDNPDVVLTDVHIRFLIDLSKQMGFCPVNNYSEACCFFSLQECHFAKIYFPNDFYLSKEASTYLYDILSCESKPYPAKSIRNELLNGLISYFIIHNEQIKKIESIAILADVLN